MCDLDSFKRCNDTYGHGAGDEALRRAAAAMKISIRSAKRAYRYGGEEFAIVLSDLDVPGSRRLAERVRHHVESLEFEMEGQDVTYGATMSCGVASFPDSSGLATDWRSLIQIADQALYAAKRAGRNCVMSPADS